MRLCRGNAILSCDDGIAIASTRRWRERCREEQAERCRHAKCDDGWLAGRRAGGCRLLQGRSPSRGCDATPRMQGAQFTGRPNCITTSARGRFCFAPTRTPVGAPSAFLFLLAADGPMVFLEVPFNSPAASPPRAARAISPFSGLPQAPTETISANTLISLTVRENARRELERLRSPLHATNSTSSLAAPTLRMASHKASVDRLNGWSVGRSLILSQSAPTLARLPPQQQQQQQTHTMRFRRAGPPPQESRDEHAAAASPPSSPGREPRHSARRDGQAFVGSAPRRGRNAPPAGSAVFLSPQRSTSLAGRDHGGEGFDCAAPGYYDFSVLSAPWTLAGNVQRPDKLSPTFLAPGRSLPPVGERAATGDRGDGSRSPEREAPQARRHQRGGGQRGARFSSRSPGRAADSGGGAATHHETPHNSPSLGEQQKLARKEREVQQLQLHLRNEARKAKGGTGGGRSSSKFKSPAMVAKAEASFESRLARATNVPKSDHAIASIMSRPTPPAFLSEFVTFDAGPQTLTGPHVHGSLSLSSAAFSE